MFEAMLAVILMLAHAFLGQGFWLTCAAAKVQGFKREQRPFYCYCTAGCCAALARAL